jgi:iduronate 2-sulfatase
MSYPSPDPNRTPYHRNPPGVRAQYCTCIQVIHDACSDTVTLWFRAFLLLLSLSSFGFGLPKSDTSLQPRPYNILFIPVDDLRPELGCYGQSQIHTPNIDALAREGLIFTQAHCSQALCNPSRASLLTGLRPDTLKVWDLLTDFRTTRPDAVTLPQHLKAHGYHSVGIGKTFHNDFPDERSWSEPELHVPGYPFDPDAVYRDDPGVLAVEHRKLELIRQGQEKKAIDRLGYYYLKTFVSESPDVPDNAYYDGAQTDMAIEKLKGLEKTGKPFFFSVGYYRPHMPFNAPKKYWDLYDRAKLPLAGNDYVPQDAPIMALDPLVELRSYVEFRQQPSPYRGKLELPYARLMKHGYYASVSYVDAQIGRLIQGLKGEGLWENTIIVLWGDHGWKLGEHNAWGKMSTFTIDTRSPLIVRVPGLKGGHRVEASVEFVDIFPTLCDLTGLPKPAALEGTSFASLLKKPDRPWKKAAFTQYRRTGRWAADDGKEYRGHSVVTSKWRYCEWYDLKTDQRAAVELYDQTNDRDENRNLALQPQYKSVLLEMTAVLKAGWRAARPN